MLQAPWLVASQIPLLSYCRPLISTPLTKFLEWSIFIHCKKWISIQGALYYLFRCTNKISPCIETTQETSDPKVLSIRTKYSKGYFIFAFYCCSVVLDPWMASMIITLSSISEHSCQLLEGVSSTKCPFWWKKSTPLITNVISFAKLGILP